jgi:hypothetical protein
LDPEQSLGLQDGFNKNAGQRGTDGRWFRQKILDTFDNNWLAKEKNTRYEKFIDDNPQYTLCSALDCTASINFYF